MSVNLFDINFYRAVNPDLASLDDAQALSHFLTNGLNEGRKFSQFADLNFYRAANPDLTSFSNQQAFEHLQNFGITEGRSFSPFVDLNFYRNSNADLTGFNNEQLFEHLRNFGITEGRSFSPLFNLNYYRANNPDLAAAGLNNNQLLQHFAQFGLLEGRSGSALTNSGDYAGNTFSTPRNIALQGISTTFRDFLGNTDSSDLYSFSLNDTSNFSLSLTGLKGNANVEILDSNGEVLQHSANLGTTAESISRILYPGDYYIWAYQGTIGSNTDYNLNLNATPSGTGSFDIQFDYRFDTNGFFNDSNRRATLEAAAKIWETTIRDEFADVPAGTATPYLINPQTQGYTGGNNIFITDAPIDDLVVFVGAKELGGTLAEGGPSGFNNNQTRYSGSNFEPWAGTITFDTSTLWYFDPTPNTSNDIPILGYDFLSTAVHELAHVLGVGTSDAFDSLTSGGYFNGPNAKAVNQGLSIPLDSDLSHVQEGFKIGGVGPDALMDTSGLTGVQDLPTPLDIAMLVDIGYQV